MISTSKRSLQYYAFLSLVERDVLDYGKLFRDFKPAKLNREFICVKDNTRYAVEGAFIYENHACVITNIDIAQFVASTDFLKFSFGKKHNVECISYLGIDNSDIECEEDGGLHLARTTAEHILDMFNTHIGLGRVNSDLDKSILNFKKHFVDKDRKENK